MAIIQRLHEAQRFTYQENSLQQLSNDLHGGKFLIHFLPARSCSFFRLDRPHAEYNALSYLLKLGHLFIRASRSMTNKGIIY